MRIAVNTRFLLPRRLEGIGWYTHEVLQRMVRAHPEDEFIFLFDRPYDRCFLYGPNVVPVVVGPPARHPVLWYLWFEGGVPQVLQRYRPAVFFSPDGYVSLRSRIPTLLTLHDLIPLQMPSGLPWAARHYYRHFLPRYVRRATHIAAVSEHVKRVAMELVQAPAERISVVYNGCREHFAPLSQADRQAVREAYADGHPYFLYVGAMHPRKNIPRLVRAFDRFKTATGAPVRLVLAGRLAWKSEPVRQALQEARHRSDIRQLNYVPEDALVRLVGAALAVVNVSLNEGFGLPIVEAFACDTPVLCSNQTALAEVAGDAAVQVDPYSEEAIAEGMTRLYSDEFLRTMLVERGRIRRQRFSWDVAAQQLYALIQATAAE